MASTRDFKSPGIFAEDASTSIPPSPIQGVAYRDAVSGADSAPDGWRYGTKVDSQDWNQIMFLLTSIISSVDKQGLLGWSSDVDYSPPAIAFGSNGLPYIALQASGPTTSAQDPISSPMFWEQFASHGQIVLTTNQSWTVPAAMRLGLVKPIVTVIAGGGGGGHTESANLGGGGGGGGGAAKGVVDLTGITTVAVTVGSGGAGAPSGTSGFGSTGGNSSFGASIACIGGGGGGNPSAGQAGTSSGAAAIVPISAAGCGTSVTPSGGITGSGGGYGGEGAAISSRPLGVIGRGFGGGGAGGGGTSGTRGGGAGAAGVVIIEW